MGFISNPPRLVTPNTLPPGTHVCGGEGEDAVKVLDELLEGGPLGGLVAPTLPHDHVAAEEARHCIVGST